MTLPALLWRYWRAHGGPDWFGLPISPVVTIDGRATVFFEQATLSLPLQPVEVGPPVQRGSAGRQQWSAYLLDAAGSP